MAGDSYNYEHFKAAHFVDPLDGGPAPTDFAAPRAGDRAVDFEAMTPDGERVRLSDWFGKPIVLETGSLTCPMFSQYVDRWNDMAAKFPDVHFLVLYVREAHPGHKRGPHVDLQDKIGAAREMIDVENERRTVLVDDLAGTAHRIYGALPNSVWLINPEGVVQFAVDNSNPHKVQEMLERYSSDQIVPGSHYDRFHEDRPSPRTLFGVLLRGGKGAIVDMVKEIRKTRAIHNAMEQADVAKSDGSMGVKG